MPYARPTLTALYAQALQDISSSDLEGVDGLLRRAVLRVLAVVMAGFSWLHYDYQDWIAKQAVPWTATDEYAAGWGALRNVFQKDAIPAVLQATFPAQPDIPVPTGTTVNRLDGFSYSTTAAVTSSGNSVTLTVTATAAGSAGNADVGTQLALQSSISGIGSTGSVTATVTSGADQETPDAYKSRYLQVYRDPVSGGDRSDYIVWAEAVPGVTRAWVQPLGMGAGTVVVFTMFDVAEEANGGFPQGTGGVATGETRAAAATGDLLTVANALYAEQPIPALVYSSAPGNSPIAFQITGLGSLNTTANQTAITSALKSMFVSLGNVGGTINPDTGEAWAPIEPSSWYAAIASAIGSQQFDVPSPAMPISVAAGYLPTLNVAATTFAS